MKSIEGEARLKSNERLEFFNFLEFLSRGWNLPKYDDSFRAESDNESTTH